MVWLAGMGTGARARVSASRQGFLGRNRGDEVNKNGEGQKLARKGTGPVNFAFRFVFAVSISRNLTNLVLQRGSLAVGEPKPQVWLFLGEFVPAVVLLFRWV